MEENAKQENAQLREIVSSKKKNLRGILVNFVKFILKMCHVKNVYDK